MQHDSQAMYEALLAEIGALSVATSKILGVMAARSDDREGFLDSALETGLDDLKRTMFSGVPNERYGAFLAQAQKRYAAIIHAAKPLDDTQ